MMFWEQFRTEFSPSGSPD